MQHKMAKTSKTKTEEEMANNTNEMEIADQDSVVSMTGHNRRIGSGRKGDPCNRTVIKAAMSLQNKHGN
eukprot:6315818-Ditylum_brightwellii.AAC.1